jgi:hypothetical protein
MSSRLTGAASLLLILISLAVVLRTHRPGDTTDLPDVSTETRQESPAQVPEEAVLVELFPRPTPSGKTQRVLQPEPQDASGVPSSERSSELYSGRKVGHVKLAGGKEMVFVRSR